MKYMPRFSMFSVSCALLLAVQSLSANSLPAPWFDTPFGQFDNANPGAAEFDNGAFTLSGSGTQMYGTDQDGGRFVFQPLAGDGEIVARVDVFPFILGTQTGRFGLMFTPDIRRDSARVIFYRAGFDAGSPFVIRGQHRTAQGANMTWQNPIISNDTPRVWLGLVRQGNVFNSYYTTNDTPTEWQPYNSVTVAMPDAVHAGIFVSKYQNPAVKASTNRFTDVMVRSFVNVAQVTDDTFEIDWTHPGGARSVLSGYDGEGNPIYEIQPPTYTTPSLFDYDDADNLIYDPSPPAYTIPVLSGYDDDGSPIYTLAMFAFTYTLSRAASADGPFEIIAEGLVESVHTNTVPDAALTWFYRVDAVYASGTTKRIGTSGANRLAFSTAAAAALAQNGYWGETFTHGAEFTMLTSGVVNTVLDTSANSNFTLYHEGYLANYTATLLPPSSGWYLFQTRFSDGGRLWLDNQAIIDDAQTLSTTTRLITSAPVWLEAGRPAHLKVDYIKYTGTAQLSVQWARTDDRIFANIPLTSVAPFPAPWRSGDFGAPLLNGLAQYDFANDTFTVVAGGRADAAGHAVFQDTPGDFSWQACVVSQSAADPKAGLMIRVSNAPDTASAACYVVDSALSVETRAETGGDIIRSAGPLQTDAPVWLRADYTGGVLAFSAKTSQEAEWTALTNFPIAFPPGSLAGVAAQATDSAALNTAVFADIRQPVRAFTRISQADTMVQMGNANSNFGLQDNFMVKQIDGTTRDSFLKFDTRGLADIHSASLRLYVLERNPAPDAVDHAATNQTIIVRRITDSTWGETNITWNTPPVGVTLPGALVADNDPTFVTKFKVPPTGNYILLDITDAVRASAVDGGTLSLQLTTSAVYSHMPAKFASKEHAAAVWRPALLVTAAAPGFTAEPGVRAGEIALSWQRTYDPRARYTVYRAAAVQGPFEVIAENLTTDTYTDTGRTPGARMWYIVTDGADICPESAVSATCDAAARGVREPAFDLYLQAGSRKNNSYNNGELVMKSSFRDDDYQREAFLKFDVSGLGNAQRVHLRLTPKYSNENETKTHITTYLDIDAVDCGDWAEAGVTWNNSPYGEPLPIRTQDLTWPDQVQKVRFHIGLQNITQEIDITQLVRRFTRTGARHMTLHIHREDNYNNNNAVFYSKTYSNAAYRPALLYALQRPNAPEVFLTNGTVRVSWAPFPNAAAYTLERAEGTPDTFTTVASGLTGTTFTDASAPLGAQLWYRVVVNNEPSDAAPFRPGSGIHRLEPVADTYIDAGDGNTIRGANTELNLKASLTPGGPGREDLFRFDVRGLEHARSVRFRINPEPRDVDYVKGGIVIHDVSDTVGDWDEMRVTWNALPKGFSRPNTNGPEPGPRELARVEIPYKAANNCHVSYVEVDVTDSVRAAAQAGHALTILVTGDDQNTHAKSYYAVASREHADATRRPVLLIDGLSAATPSIRTTSDAQNSGNAVSWLPVTGASGYTVTRIETDGTETVLLANSSDTAFSDTGLWNRDVDVYTYRIDAHYPDGSTTTLTNLALRIERTFSQPILADTFIQSGAHSNAVNGVSREIGIKSDIGDTCREVYLRINLTDLPEKVTAASLALTVATLGSDPTFEAVAEAIPDTGWIESGTGALTWTEVYGPTAGIISVPRGTEAANRVDVRGLAVNDTISFNITDLVTAARARNETTLTLRLFATPQGANRIMFFKSRETADRGEQPQVIFTVPAHPSQGALFFLR